MTGFYRMSTMVFNELIMLYFLLLPELRNDENNKKYWQIYVKITTVMILLLE